MFHEHAEDDVTGISAYATCRKGHRWQVMYQDIPAIDCAHCGTKRAAYRKVTPEKCYMCRMRFDYLERIGYDHRKG